MPIDSAKAAFASAVPEIVAVCSAALMRSSEATAAIIGALGAIVSTVILRAVAAETLPAASVAVADSGSAPWPMAVMSAGVSV